MKRICACFSDAEYELICAEAEKAGLSVSKYVAQNTLLKLKLPLVSKGVKELYDEIDNYMHQLPPGKTFNCSATIHDWANLNRGQKMIVSKYITKVVNESPELYKVLKPNLNGNAKRYQKI